VLENARYSGPGRMGCSRPLTETETQQWQAATARWSDAPPWTAEKEADNEAVRALLISLYEDGVSLPSLAAAAGWGHSRVAGILHRLRQAGRLSGQRRYIAPAAKPEKAPFRRDLTDAERTDIRSMYALLPQHASGARGWRSAQAQRLLNTLDALARDRVALDTLGDALGVKRQAIHQHLTRFRAEQTTATEAVSAA
jgi:hypothetical protein